MPSPSTPRKTKRASAAVHARYDAKRTDKLLSIRMTAGEWSLLAERAAEFATSYEVSKNAIFRAALSVGLQSPTLAALLELAKKATRPATPPKAPG